MALQVWLPYIDGTNKNQGLSQLSSPTYNTMSSVDAGKLGKASAGCTIYHLSSDILTGNWSVACWIKFPSSYSPYNNIILCFNTSDSEDSKLYLSIVSNSYLNIGRGSSSGVTYTLSGGFVSGTWYHLCASFNGTITCLYLNGTLVNSGQVGTSKAALNFGIGCRSNNAAGTSATGASYTFNDVRIYDHCLSPKEVKEISKGLVLHYKLDDPYIEATTNIASTLTPQANNGGWGRMTATNIGTNAYHLKHTYGSSSNPSYWSTFVYTLPSDYANKTISFSVKLKNIQCTALNMSTSWIFVGQGNDGTYPTHGSVTKYYSQLTEYMTISWTGTLSNSHRYLVVELWNNDTSTSGKIEFDLFDIQIEEKDHVTPYTDGTRTPICYDCSGYGRNGIVASNPSIATSTPRYKASTNFADSATSITIGNFSTMVPDGNFTFNCWFMKKTGEWSSKGYETIFGGPSGFELEAKNGGINSPSLVPWNWGKNAITYELDKWNMVTFTRNANETKLYLNGGETVTTGTAGTIPSGTYFIGAWRSAAEQNYRGYLSDVRIFSTVLSADDIKDLYQTSASIHNTGAIDAFEFEEINSGSRELNPFAYANGSSTVYLSNGDFRMTDIVWPSSDYIPINPTGKTYYYDIEYSNTSGSHLYIGFEKYDANKQSGSNSECQYMVSTTSAATHSRVTGTINLSTANGNTAAYTKLRLLNNWDSASGSPTSLIHHISLKEVATKTVSDVKKNGVFEGDTFIEENDASISETANVIGKEIIEI